jgi:hypothetical protein
MTPKDFANEFAVLKEVLLNEYFNKGETEVSIRIKKMGLSDSQLNDIKKLIDVVLTDSLYTVALGLDGCGSIGEKQIQYKVIGENNEALAGNGILEYHAYDLLQNK